MSGIRESKKRATRQSIIEAAVRLFGRDGFEKTSIEKIAREAGVGKGTIYGYFGAKEEIFLAFCEDEIDYAFAELAAKNDADAPLHEQVLTLFMSQFGFATRNAEFGRLLAREMAFPRMEHRKKSRALDARYLRGVGAVLERARQRGELRPEVDLLFATGHLYALYLLILSSWYSGYLHDEREVATVLRVMLHQALVGLGEPSPPVGVDDAVLERVRVRTLAGVG
jgi:AcrR family transcriptional regulator